MATHLLHANKPFNAYPFGKLAATLTAQIQRQHYVFTLREQEVVGYVGWALCSEKVAQDWIVRNVEPRSNACLEGDHWIALTWFAAQAGVVQAQARYLRGLYPGKIGIGRRDYGNGLTRVKRFRSFSSSSNRSDDDAGHSKAEHSP